MAHQGSVSFHLKNLKGQKEKEKEKNPASRTNSHLFKNHSLFTRFFRTPLQRPLYTELFGEYEWDIIWPTPEP